MEKIGAPYAWAARTELRCKKCNESKVFYGEDIDERERWKDLHFKDGQLVCSGKYAPHIRSQVEDIIALGRPDAPMQRQPATLVVTSRQHLPPNLPPGNVIVLDEIDEWPNVERTGVYDSTQQTPELNEERRLIIEHAIQLGNCHDIQAELFRRASRYVQGEGLRPEPIARQNPTRHPLYVDVENRRRVEPPTALSNSDFEQLPEGDRPSPAFIDFMNDLLREVSPRPNRTRGRSVMEDFLTLPPPFGYLP